MTIIQLEYALAVAKYQNFTVASEHCCVTQPTLSMQIQKLEEELKVKIFNRSKKPIQLTDIGQKIVAQAKIIVDESNRLNEIVHQEKGYIGGDFRLGIIPTIMPTLLPMFLKNFNNHYPKVRLLIEEVTTEQIIKKLIDGHLDAGLGATPLENEVIKEKVLYYEPFMALIPDNHKLSNKKKLSINDLELNDLLLLEDGHCFRNNILNLCQAYKKENQRKFQLESGNIETLIKLSKEGLGMTLIPYLHTLDFDLEERKQLYEFERPFPSREVSLLYHKSQLKKQIIEALGTTISNIVRGAIAFNDIKIISPLKK